MSNNESSRETAKLIDQVNKALLDLGPIPPGYSLCSVTREEIALLRAYHAASAAEREIVDRIIAHATESQE